MKKVYLSLLCLASATLATAQSLSIAPQMMKKNALFTESAKAVVNNSTEKTAIWSNDFTTPGDWSFGNLETIGTSGDNDNWTIGTSGGAGTYALAALISNSGGNFGLFDSDNLCSSSGSQSGWMQNVTPFSCTGQSSVMVKFQNYYRKFNAHACFVGVSTDGVVWTDIQVNGGLVGTAATANGELCQVNISSVAANQATVYIRFLYKSQGAAPAYGCDYNWMVDDVNVTSVDDYDLSLDKVIWGSTGAWGGVLPYHQVPVAQVQAIEFCGVVSNKGLITQSDIVFTATCAAASYAGVTTAQTLATDLLDTFCVAPTYTPSTTPGTSTISFNTLSAATDANPASNVQPSTDVVVNDFIYARDNTVPTSNTWNDGLAYEAGNIYDIYNPATIYSIEVVLNSQTVVGSVVYGVIYDPTANPFMEVARTDDYILTANDISVTGTPHVLSIPLQTPYDAAAASSVCAVIGTLGSTTPDVVISTSGNSEPQTSFYMDETATWFYSTSTPMVRLNFDPSSSIKELTNTVGVNVYPNPASSEATVSYKLANASSVVVTVVDLTGKTVYTNNLGTVNTGAHNVTVNTESISNGVYMVNVSVNGSVSTEKLVIRK